MLRWAATTQTGQLLFSTHFCFRLRLPLGLMLAVDDCIIEEPSMAAYVYSNSNGVYGYTYGVETGGVYSYTYGSGGSGGVYTYTYTSGASSGVYTYTYTYGGGSSGVYTYTSTSGGTSSSGTSSFDASETFGTTRAYSTVF